jgi:CHAT domain-containing protein
MAPSDPTPHTEAPPTKTIFVLCKDALSCLDRSPRQACSLAREAYELARRVEQAYDSAESALTLAIVLNRLGEFRGGLHLSRDAVGFALRAGEGGKITRGLCEAALAETFIGQLNDAAADLQRVRAGDSSPLVQARGDWIDGRIYRDRGRYPESEAFLRKACDAFQAAALPLEAARCERELARTYLLCDRDPMPLLQKARLTFESDQARLDAALCDWFNGVFLYQTNQYRQAAALLLSTRQTCLEEGATFFAAACDMELGVTYRHLSQFDQALEALHLARDYFLSHGIPVEVSACDINLGSAYYVLNRYDEALTHYQQAAEFSHSEERLGRAARIYTNMALVYSQKGLFAKSIALNQRALEIASAQAIPVLAGHCHVNLAIAYRQLGQYSQALKHLTDAREIFLKHGLQEYLASDEINLAEIHLVFGASAEAEDELEHARMVSKEIGLEAFVAVCDRLLAQAVGRAGERERALGLIAKSRAHFLKNHQVVDAALCDLAEGELHFDWNEVSVARERFYRARETLAPGFPDQAWRAEYGLGRCDLSGQERTAALEHFLLAMRTIDRSRSMLVAEQLSNDFFSHRQSVYQAALSVALQEGAAESALECIEAAKARAFLALLQQRDWKTPRAQTDPYIADLIAREKSLRYQLTSLRRRATVQTERDDPVAFHSDSGLAISGEALLELKALNQAYESIVTQLRLATSGLTGVSDPAPFALDKFRDAVTAVLGADWTALDYSLDDDQVVIAVIGPQNLRVDRVPLTGYNQAVIRKCTTEQPELRELIYRETIHGQRAASVASQYLRHLHRLLIPQGIDATTLIIAPHGLLHALPYQALMGGEGYLIEQHSLIYAPSLQIMQLLLSAPTDTTSSKSLFYGIENFNTPMSPLPSAGTEIERMRGLFQERGEYFFGEQASRQKLLDLNTTQGLKQFALLHFATHAILDREAPHQSRVLLSDEPLTVTDVLDLALNARLVTLSGCQTALSQGGSGDELTGLARAFFYAGARALLATLWPVEDGSIGELVERTYRHWMEGGNAGQAVQQAQIEMIEAGYSPYQWAPFVLMGRP